MSTPKATDRVGSNRRRAIAAMVALTALTILLAAGCSSRYRFEGSSMEPSLHNGNYVIADKLAYVGAEPQRGDIVVFAREGRPGDYLKRVIGLPGETIEIANGVVYIDGQPLDEPYIVPASGNYPAFRLGDDEYFMIGDNRGNSQDSRSFGPVSLDDIEGRAWIVYWPPDDAGFVPRPDYGGSDIP
jgi:signal peptidase I